MLFLSTSIECYSCFPVLLISLNKIPSLSDFTNEIWHSLHLLDHCIYPFTNIIIIRVVIPPYDDTDHPDSSRHCHSIMFLAILVTPDVCFNLKKKKIISAAIFLKYHNKLQKVGTILPAKCPSPSILAGTLHIFAKWVGVGFPNPLVPIYILVILHGVFHT